MKKSRNLKSGEIESMISQIERDYDITDSAGIFILSKIRESQARLSEAMEILKKEGIVTVDRWGQSKVHPCVLIERDCRAAILAGIKQLNLDLEPLRDRAGRPPGSRL
jgi:hypothetical protein